MERYALHSGFRMKLFLILSSGINLQHFKGHKKRLSIPDSQSFC